MWAETYITISKESKQKKVNKLLKYFPTDDTMELNELIYAGEQLVDDKIHISLGIWTETQNLEWKMRIEEEEEIKKMRQQAKLVRKRKSAET